MGRLVRTRTAGLQGWPTAAPCSPGPGGRCCPAATNPS